jgi:hypothetical protein
MSAQSACTVEASIEPSSPPEAVQGGTVEPYVARYRQARRPGDALDLLALHRVKLLP